MPRSLDPSSRLTLVLACDVDKPVEVQPRLYARCLTLNQQRKLIDAIEGLRDSESAAAKMESALDAAAICLVGWENVSDPVTQQPIPFSREAIGDVLSIQEIIEIFEAVIGASVPSPEDKKKSG